MNNDYERYDFWHREMSQINKEKSVDNTVETNDLLDGNKHKDRSEKLPDWFYSIL